MTCIIKPVAEASLQVVRYRTKSRDNFIDIPGLSDIENKEPDEREGYFLGSFCKSSTSYDDYGHEFQHSSNYALVIDKETGEVVRIDLDEDSDRLRFNLE